MVIYFIGLITQKNVSHIIQPLNHTLCRTPSLEARHMNFSIYTQIEKLYIQNLIYTYTFFFFLNIPTYICV